MKRRQLLKPVMPKLFISIAVLAILPSPSCSTQGDHCTGHNDCLNKGTCVNGTSSNSCVCAQGFTGIHCEINIDDCAGHSRCLNGGTCVDGVSSYTCACVEAEFFGNHCEHPNECVYPGTCSSLNTLSQDAKCKCREGYAPDPYDGRRCEPVTNQNATLIFGSWGSDEGIEQFSLSQETVTRIQSFIHFKLSWALDVMYRTNTMFWSEDYGKIYTAPIRQGAAKRLVLNDPDSYISAVAVDWVYDHLYFSDHNRNTINVANLDGSMKKVLFTTGVPNTWAIVVDPLSGWIYWADREASTIERAAMDGSGREVIVNTKPKCPQGLALDMTQNRLYWTAYDDVENLPATIHSMNVDGSDQKIVFQGTQPTALTSHFWSITTFGDFVYWKDYETLTVYKTNKCGGGGATKIHSTPTAYYYDTFYTLQAYHYSKQPGGVNYCENRIGGQCSHLCFRVPFTGNQSVATNCACPDGLTLSSDQQTCT